MRRTLLALGLLAVVVFAHSGALAGSQGDGAADAAPAAAADQAAAAGQAPAAGDREPTSGGGHGDAGEGAAGEPHSHGGPVVPVLLGLIVILAAAKLGGELFERIGQPAVLGELIFGVVLGNLTLVGYGGLEFLETNLGVEILAQIGVMLLLFEVGLESDVKEMLSVGVSSLLVASLGVIAPFFLGWGVSAWLLPEEDVLAHVFIGATLCATSVGITARVLKDLGKVNARESRIILGAAVIDDVMGLVVLAVVTGIISAANTGQELAVTNVVMIVVKACLFLGGAVVVGGWLSPRVFRLASRLRIKGMLLTVSLLFLFVLSYLADYIGLATIVGSFAAGLVLDEVHYKDFIDRGDHHLEDLIHPINTFLVPIFFVWIGARVDLVFFGDPDILGFAALLTVAAIIGKMICAGGVVERGLDRVSVAVGMVPRGEVGLIFASMGASMMIHGERVIVPSVFGAVVIMVVVTTLITPPALKVTLAWGDRKKARRAEAQAPPG